MDMKEFRARHTFDSIIRFLVENGNLKTKPEYSDYDEWNRKSITPHHCKGGNGTFEQISKRNETEYLTRRKPQ
jgi:hypothetical protein